MKRFWLPLILVACTVALYFTSLEGQFLNYDDELHVVNNSYIHTLSFKTIWGLFTHSHFSSYMPLSLLSLALDFRIYGLNPVGYHITNLLFYIAIVLLIYYFVLQEWNSYESAFVAAFLFLILPIHVEVVAWITARKDLLSTFFLMLSWILFSKASLKGSLLMFVLAIFSKQTVVMFPLLLLLYSVWVKGEGWSVSRLYSILPFGIVSIVGAASALMAQQLTGYAHVPHGGSFLHQSLLQMEILQQYVSNLILPFHLSAFYFFEKLEDLSLWKLVNSGIFLILLIVMMASLYQKKQRRTLFWMVWFFLNLLPVLQWVPVSVVMADRYLFISSIAPCIGVSLWFSSLREKRFYTVSLMCAFSILFIILSIQRMGVWSNNLSFWSDAVANAPESYVVNKGMALTLDRAGKFNEALAYYGKTLKLAPNDAECMNNVGAIYATLGKADRARSYFEQAIKTNPGLNAARRNLNRL